MGTGLVAPKTWHAFPLLHKARRMPGAGERHPPAFRGLAALHLLLPGRGPTPRATNPHVRTSRPSGVGRALSSVPGAAQADPLILQVASGAVVTGSLCRRLGSSFESPH
jgi:hypothetical protein